MASKFGVVVYDDLIYLAFPYVFHSESTNSIRANSKNLIAMHF